MKAAKEGKRFVRDARWDLYVRVLRLADARGLIVAGYFIEMDPRQGQEEWVRVWGPTGKCVAGWSDEQTWTDVEIDSELADVGRRQAVP